MLGKTLSGNWQLIAARFHQEYPRLILWVPVCMMVGAGAYFALPQEPNLWLGGQAVVGFGTLLFMAWRRAFRPLAIGVFAVALGFACAQWRTHSMQGPLLSEPLHYVQVEGRVVEVATTPKGAKLRIAAPVIEGLTPEATPRAVRLTVRGDSSQWQVGDVLRARAELNPLPEPVMPGAYDFARYFYFEGIGAVGFTMQPPVVVERTPPSRWQEWLASARHHFAQGLRARMEGDVAEVAAALTVGEMSGISDATEEAMRDSGLSHILSISGLHLALASGLVFFAVRLGLALVPGLAVRWPIKKIAAAAALAGAFAYLMLAGYPVPAQRSFIMVAFVLLAVLIDRRGISVYSLAWAAVFILLFFPESMLGASFQMSFAATLGIVALYERFGHWLYRAEARWWQRAGYYFLAVLLTSLVATLATAPFVIYHFNRFSAWGMVANMAVAPLTSALIMPGVVLALVLAPLGLPQPGVWMMDVGIRGMIWVAERAATLPHAVIPLPSPTNAGMLVCVLGLLWLTLWRTRLSLLGLPLVVVGLSTLLLHRPPDVLISGDLRQVMVRLESGEYTPLKGNGRAFVAEAWLRALAQNDFVKLKDSGIPCDSAACTYTRAGHTLVLVKEWDFLPELCAKPTDVLAVWRYVDTAECPGAQALISRRELAAGGAHALWFTPEGIETRTTRGDEVRPWVVASVGGRSAD